MFLVFLAIIVLACTGRRFSGRRRSWGQEGRSWPGRSEPGRHQPSTSIKERFEEWHRTTHGREPADDRAPSSDDTELV